MPAHLPASPSYKPPSLPTFFYAFLCREMFCLCLCLPACLVHLWPHTSAGDGSCTHFPISLLLSLSFSVILSPYLPSLSLPPTHTPTQEEGRHSLSTLGGTFLLLLFKTLPCTIFFAFYLLNWISSPSLHADTFARTLETPPSPQWQTAALWRTGREHLTW